MAKGIYVGGWARRVTISAMIADKESGVAVETQKGFLFRHGGTRFYIHPGIINDSLVALRNAKGNHPVWPDIFCAIDSRYLGAQLESGINVGRPLPEIPTTILAELLNKG